MIEVRTAKHDKVVKTRLSSLKRIMLELIHLSLVFFSRIVDMWNTLPLFVRQATTIASFKKGVRDFLAGNM